ncbi:MAG: hypothetical protein OEY44_02240 [Candidatus Peregrinibacteria bacterium]|nr:hypothetical protein [Candidatus Peregrinibacteria bacterium]
MTTPDQKKTLLDASTTARLAAETKEGKTLELIEHSRDGERAVLSGEAQEVDELSNIVTIGDMMIDVSSDSEKNVLNSLKLISESLAEETLTGSDIESFNTYMRTIPKEFIKENPQVAILGRSIVSHFRAVAKAAKEGNPIPSYTPPAEPTSAPEAPAEEAVSKAEPAPAPEKKASPPPLPPRKAPKAAAEQKPEEARDAEKPETPAPQPSAPAEVAKPPKKKPRVAPPQSLSDSIALFVKDEAEKRERLMELWMVVLGKSTTGNPEQDETIRKIFDHALKYSSEKNKQIFAETRFKKLLTDFKGVEVKSAVTIAQEREAQREVAEVSERVATIKKLQTRLNSLTTTLPDLKERFELIFEILQRNPEDVEDSDHLRGVQADVEEVLLKQVPTTMGLEGECASLDELLSKLNAKRVGELLMGAQALNEELQSAQMLNMLLDNYQKMKSDEGSDQKAEKKDKDDSDKGSGGEGGGTPGEGSSGGSAAPAGAFRDSAKAEQKDGEEAGSNTEGSSAPEEGSVAEALSSPAKRERIEALLKRMSFSIEDDSPAIRAILITLAEKELSAEAFNSLENFLKNAQLPDEIEELVNKHNTLEALKKKATETRNALLKAEEESKLLNLQFQAITKRREAPSPEQLERYNELQVIKADMTSNLEDLRAAVMRMKERKGKETKYYRRPEQLLSMIMYYFAQNELPEGETPDYAKILQDSQDMLEQVRQRDVGIRHEVANFLTLGVLKPTLAQMLRKISEKDPNLKKLSEEQMTALARVAEDPKAVDHWISGLEGSENEKMERLLPAIIGHLDAAVNAGGAARLNSLASIRSARNLAHNLRESLHKYALELAEKASGKNIDKMQAYFNAMNKINRNCAEVSKDVVRNNMALIMGRNAFIGTGTALGGWAVAGLGGVGLTLAGGSALTGGTLLSSFRTKSEKAKSILRKSALRTGVATGLAAGSVAALGISALPALAIAGGGLFAVDTWRNRKAIKEKSIVAGQKALTGAKWGWAGTKVGARVWWGSLGVALGVTALTLPLWNDRFRRFFGLTLPSGVPSAA